MVEPARRHWAIHPERTSEAQGLNYCNGCGECCRSAPCLLKPEDVGRIAAHLKVTKAWFAKQCLDRIRRTIEGEGGGTWWAVRPKMRDGACMFLDPDDRCSIHEVKPWGGKDFECWTPGKRESDRDLLAWWNEDDVNRMLQDE